MTSHPPPRTGRDVLRYCLRGARRDLALSMGSSFVRQLAFLAIPWLLGRGVQAVADGDGTAVAQIAALLAVAVLVEFGGLCGWIWWANLGEARLAGTLREWQLDAVLRARDGELDAVADGNGDLLARAVDDVDSVLVWIHGLATWVVITTTVVVLVPAFAAMDPLLLVVALACSAVLVLLNIGFPRLFRPRMRALVTAQAARTQVVVDLLAATVPLRGVGGEGRMVDRHDRCSAELTGRVRSLAGVAASWDAATFAVPPAAVAIGLVAGGLAAVDGRMDVGQLTTFALWMGTVQRASAAAVARLGDRGAAVVAADRIAAVLALRPVTPDRAGGTSPVVADGGTLDLDGLAVVRGGQTLGPVTATVPPGCWLVLTGPTGSGKSTLLRAVAGLVEHDGAVRYDGGDLAALDRDDRFERATLVPQGPLLLHGTVRENLLLGAPTGRPDPTDEQLHRVCAAACFDTVLRGLPDGLDSLVGERGATLSGGERQRLALARALLRRTPVLLLDDVSSALDVPTERELIRRLRTATGDRVVVWAGHRGAVRDAADLVVDLAPADRLVARHG